MPSRHQRDHRTRIDPAEHSKAERGLTANRMCRSPSYPSESADENLQRHHDDVVADALDTSIRGRISASRTLKPTASVLFNRRSKLRREQSAKSP